MKPSEPKTPLQKRYLLRRRIEVLMGKARKSLSTARQDRETQKKWQELERGLDRAIREDRTE